MSKRNYYVNDIMNTEKKNHLNVMLNLRTAACPMQQQNGVCEVYAKTRSKADGMQHDCFYYHSYLDQRRTPIINGCIELYRPALCHHHSNNPGKCPYGNDCKYAHGFNELLFHPSIYKTKQCKYSQNNYRDCPSGEYCCYAHGRDDLRMPSTVDSKSPSASSSTVQSPSNRLLTTNQMQPSNSASSDGASSARPKLIYPQEPLVYHGIPSSPDLATQHLQSLQQQQDSQMFSVSPLTDPMHHRSSQNYMRTASPMSPFYILREEAAMPRPQYSPGVGIGSRLQHQALEYSPVPLGFMTMASGPQNAMESDASPLAGEGGMRMRQNSVGSVIGNGMMNGVGGGSYHPLAYGMHSPQGMYSPTIRADSPMASSPQLQHSQLAGLPRGNGDGMSNGFITVESPYSSGLDDRNPYGYVEMQVPQRASPAASRPYVPAQRMNHMMKSMRMGVGGSPDAITPSSMGGVYAPYGMDMYGYAEGVGMLRPMCFPKEYMDSSMYHGLDPYGGGGGDGAYAVPQMPMKIFRPDPPNVPMQDANSLYDYSNVGSMYPPKAPSNSYSPTSTPSSAPLSTQSQSIHPVVADPTVEDSIADYNDVNDICESLQSMTVQ